MTKFLNPSFQTGSNSQKYRDNYDRIFRSKEEKTRKEFLEYLETVKEIFPNWAAKFCTTCGGFFDPPMVDAWLQVCDCESCEVG